MMLLTVARERCEGVREGAGPRRVRDALWPW